MKRVITTSILIMGIFSNLFGGDKPKEEKKNFPPVPAWMPDIVLPIDKIVERFGYYTDNRKDFVVLKRYDPGT